MKPAKILFIDRDNTLIQCFDHQNKNQKVQFMPGIIDFLGKYFNIGYDIAIITNQSAIAKNQCTLFDYLEMESRVETMLFRCGISILGTWYCPHWYTENQELANNCNGEFFYQCDCRKPLPGLFKKFEKDMGYVVDKENSFMLGDNIIDKEAANAFGIAGFLTPIDSLESINQIYLRKQL